MQSVLDACRRLFGPAPRQFSDLATRRYLQTSPPDWLRRQPQHPLWTSAREEASLFREGEIVWGHLLEAHGWLLNPGNIDYPALAIFRHDAGCNDCLEELNLMRLRLHELKRERPADQEVCRFVEMLDDVFFLRDGCSSPILNRWRRTLSGHPDHGPSETPA